MSYFKNDFKKKWAAAKRTHERFIKEQETWLNGNLEIPCTINKPGRPKKPFTESGKRTKRRRTESIREVMNCEELIFAAKTKLNSSGQKDAAHLLQEFTESPTRATKYKRAYLRRITEEPGRLSPIEALSKFVEAGLSRKQYNIMRTKQYPCYSVLQEEKKLCYPKPESFDISAIHAEINLQDLLDHTAERLILYLEEVVNSLSEDERATMKLVTKWGCDGSQQSQFRQKFDHESDSDSHIFQSSMVPLRIICGDNKVIWRNPTPSSPRYCRPIRIRFVKESTDVTTDEITYIEEKIKNLKPTQIHADIAVSHSMMFTMVDGKVCNAATGTTSTLKCYICGASSKQFNNLERKIVDDENAYKFGLSILHARIRFLESMLHLSYRLPVKKWQQKLDDNEKALISARKKSIQDEFRSKMGIIVDVPKAGFGTTNDGNTSRRFFSDPELSASITGLDYNLIYRLKVILEVISSGHNINIELFAKYTLDTAKHYVKLYSWYPMTPTLHKVLIHASTIIRHTLLPIGELSEEAAEARNKHFRAYRLDYARKFSREECNRDIINRLLLTSDPLLSSIRPKPRRSTNPFSKDCIELLLPGEIDISEKTEEEESGDEESSDVFSD